MPNLMDILNKVPLKITNPIISATMHVEITHQTLLNFYVASSSFSYWCGVFCGLPFLFGSQDGLYIHNSIRFGRYSRLTSLRRRAWRPPAHLCLQITYSLIVASGEPRIDDFSVSAKLRLFAISSIVTPQQIAGI